MKNVLALFCGCFTGIFLQAQTSRPDVIASSGGFASGPGFTNSYTVGEMTMVSTFTTGSFILTQGFQQPQAGATGFAPVNENASVETYPNPSNGDVFLEYDLESNAVVTIEIFNLPGQLLASENSERTAGHQRQSVDLSAQPEGIYFIRTTIRTANSVSSHTSKITLAQ